MQTKQQHSVTAAFDSKETLQLKRNRTNEKHKNTCEQASQCVRQSIHELNLQGISRVCNANYSWPRRAFWGCLWLAFLMLCTVHFYFSLRRFLYNPATVDASYEENATIAAPCVTICPTDNRFRNPAVWQPLIKEHGDWQSYVNAYDLMVRSNMTVAELWNISRIVMPNESYGMNQIIESGIMNGLNVAQEDVERSEIVTVTGICTTYKPKTEPPCVGMQSGIAIMDRSEWLDSSPSLPKMYSVIFHTEAETPLLRYYGPLLSGSYVVFGHSTVAAVRVQEVTLKNLLNRPCISEEKAIQCVIRCFERKLFNATLEIKPCRLPYMVESNKLIPCKTANEFQSMYNATEFTIGSFNTKLCGCSQPCKKRFYREDYQNRIKTNEMFALYVMVPRCLVERIDEQIQYDFATFFSDVGGALGLLLGLSMINVVEILEIIFLKVCLSKRFVKLKQAMRSST